jgi:hypothetical protein
MQHLEGSGTPVLYIGRKVPKGYKLDPKPQKKIYVPWARLLRPPLFLGTICFILAQTLPCFLSLLSGTAFH